MPPRFDVQNSPLRDINYAYHFDASLYARFLRKLAESRGVIRVEGKITHATQREGDGQRVVDVAGDGDEVRNEVEREREVADERSQEELVPPGHARVAEQAPHEHDAVADAARDPAYALPAAREDEDRDERGVDDSGAGRGERQRAGHVHAWQGGDARAMRSARFMVHCSVSARRPVPPSAAGACRGRRVSGTAPAGCSRR